MNRRDAELLNQKTLDYLIKMAQELKIDPLFASQIVNQHLEIIPEISKKNMIFLGTDSFSLKPGNIKLDIKGLLIATTEFFVSLSLPENGFNYIQLALLAFMFSAKISTQKSDHNCSLVVYALDQSGAYNFYITEEQLKKKLTEIYKSTNCLPISNLSELINQLLNMKIIKMKNGKIALNEFVWGKV